MPTKHNHDPKTTTSCPNSNCILHDESLFKKYFEARNAKKPQFCRIHLPGEGMWGIVLTDTMSIVNNVPLTDKFGLHDIVETDGNGEYVKTLLRMTWTFGIRYPLPKGDDENLTKTKEFWKSLVLGLKENNLDPEGALPGLASVAAPVGMTKTQAKKVIRDINAKLQTKITVLMG